MKKTGFLIIVFFLLFASCRKDSERRVSKFHRKDVGSWSNELLSDKKYKSVTVQIIYMEGFKPTDEAVAAFKSLIEARCNKPDGVDIVYSSISAQGKSSYSIENIIDIENDHRSEFTYRKDIAVTFIFLDGPSAENSGSSVILGEAYYNTSLVMFEKTIIDNTGGFGEPDRSKLETVVMNHELGHILGLVDLGSGMQTNHHDSSHPAHCDNENCLMYWEAETGNMFGNLLGSTPVPTLDDNCINDLRANGGK